MATDRVEFLFTLIDKASGPAGRAARGFGELTETMHKVESGAEGVSKATKAAQALTVALRSLQIVAVGLDIVNQLGGIDKLKGAFAKAGQGIRSFFGNLKPMMRKAAPYAAAGGAGFGLFKLFSGGAAAAGATAAAVGGISLAAGAAAVAIGGLAAVAMAKLGSAAFSAAEWAQSMRMSLGTVSRDTAAGAEQFDRIRGLAARLGLNVRNTVEEFQRLRNVGFLPSDAERITKLTADLRSLGVRTESVGSILNAMGKIKAQGKLQGDELMMLAEAGVNVGAVYDHLGKALGKTRDEITSMQSAGKLEAAPALAAIEAAIMEAAGESRAGEAAEKVADQTLRGFIGKMRGGLENWFIDFGTRLTPLLDSIGAKLTDTFTSLSESGKLDELTEKLFEAFHFAGAWILQNWPSIESIVVGAIDLVMASIDAMLDTIRWAQDNWETLRVIMWGAAIVMGVLAAGGALISAPFLVAGAAIIGVIYALGALVAWVVNAATEAWTAASNWGSSIIDGLVSGITNGVSRAVEAARGMANSVKGAVMGALGIASPSKVFEQFGAFSAEGFAIGMQSGGAPIESAATSMRSAASGELSAAGGTTVQAGGNRFQIDIHQQPGESSEDLVGRLEAMLDRKLGSAFEGLALASTG